MLRRALLSLATIGLLTGCGSTKQPGADWPRYNGNLASQRYSSLTTITPANAASLKPVCTASLDEEGALQSGIVVLHGTMYVTTAHKTYALDAATCAKRWESVYTPAGPEPFPVDRGVAISGNRLFRGEPDGHLIALDLATGKQLWDVAPASGARGEFLSSAPIVWRHLLFIGTAGSDWGVKGRMMAFDTATGHQVWAFGTIAPANTKAGATWKNVRSRDTGGGGMWTSYTIDRKSGELFVPVANPAPDFAAAYRPGANLYTDSLVVLDAMTGKLKWYYQMVPHDSHDWDMSAAPVLYTSSTGTPMVAASGKDGYIYGIDRTTHKLVYSTPEVRIKNFNTPPTIAGINICPGVLGGSEWNGPADDRKDHLLITPMDDWCATLKLGATRYIPGRFFFGGTYVGTPISQARGTLTATDPSTGKIVWQYRATAPMLAGVTPTAGGVTFTGDMAGNLLAFNSRTGALLYKHKTQGSIAGGVITYAVDGKQYVAATSGNISRLTWGAQGKPSIVVYSL